MAWMEGSPFGGQMSNILGLAEGSSPYAISTPSSKPLPLIMSEFMNFTLNGEMTSRRPGLKGKGCMGADSLSTCQVPRIAFSSAVTTASPMRRRTSSSLLEPKSAQNSDGLSPEAQIFSSFPVNWNIPRKTSRRLKVDHLGLGFRVQLILEHSVDHVFADDLERIGSDDDLRCLSHLLPGGRVSRRGTSRRG